MAKRSREIDKDQLEQQQGFKRQGALDRMPEKNEYREVTHQHRLEERFREKSGNRRTLDLPEVKGFNKTGAITDGEIKEYMAERFPEKHANSVILDKVSYEDRYGGSSESIKRELAAEVGKNVHEKYLNKRELEEWKKLSGEQKAARVDFAENYMRYINDPESLKKENQKKYEFMRDHVFDGKDPLVRKESEIRPAGVDRLTEKQETEASRRKREEIVEKIISEKNGVAGKGEAKDNTHDFHLVDEREYRNELKIRDPNVSDSEIDYIGGFQDPVDNQAFVPDRGDTLLVSCHEKLHQKSNSDLPTRLNEGLTEYFAREKAGAIGNLKNIDQHGREIPKPKSDYEREVGIVRKLDASIGREPLDKAYFEGRTDILKSEVDAIFGEGSYEKITTALEKRDYQAADRIITKNR
jgi:hypothetical protein